MKPKTASAVVIAVAAGLLVVGLLPTTEQAITITYVYSTDFADLAEPQIDDFNDGGLTIDGRAVRVDGVALTSGEAMIQIQAGSLSADAWTPAASVWGNLYGQRESEVTIETEVEALALSPQVIAMWAPCARELGWSATSQPSWTQVLELADTEGAGTTHCQNFALGGTYPSTSTSGLLAMASWYDWANKRQPLTVRALRHDAASQRIVREIEYRIVGYWQSSTQVMEHICAAGPLYVDAVYLQENTLVTNNNPGCLLKRNPEGMVAVYPSDGAYVADYPYYRVVSSDSTALTQQAAAQFGTWLKSRLNSEVAGSFGFRTPGLDPVGLVDDEHGALPELPPDATVDHMPSGDVARWLQEQWQDDCGGGECRVFE